ncbi:hypothetical protein C9890_0273 [Perkinsus sp. BL_2016]|nr:hypothetical protein C9890_0273 [Perkinsus sp. BL_2016]
MHSVSTKSKDYTNETSSALLVQRVWRQFRRRSQIRARAHRALFLRRHEEHVRLLQRKVAVANRLALSPDTSAALCDAAVRKIQRRWRLRVYCAVAKATLNERRLQVASTVIQHGWRRWKLRNSASLTSNPFSPISFDAPSAISSFIAKHSTATLTSTSSLIEQYVAFRQSQETRELGKQLFTARLVHRSRRLHFAVQDERYITTLATGKAKLHSVRATLESEFRELGLCGPSVKSMPDEHWSLLERLSSRLSAISN